MTKTRREFTPAFRREEVALLDSNGRPQMQARSWRRRARVSAAFLFVWQ